MSTFSLVELSRRLENLIRIGTIAEVDYAAARVRVAYGEDEQGQVVKTDWLPWLTRRAGNDIDWWAPELNEQVLLVCPSGELALGVVLPAIYQNDYPAPANAETIRRVNFGDGSFVEYDRAAHKMTVTNNGGDTLVNTVGNLDAAVGGDASVNAGGNVDIDAGGNATVDAANIILNGGTSGGVVCQAHVCSFTGSPHPQGSLTVSAGD